MKFKVFSKFFIYFQFLTIVVLIVGCKEEENVIRFTAEQTGRLLSNDSTKNWLLTNKEINGMVSVLEPCEAENTLTFGNSTEIGLSTLFYDDDCEETVIYDGFWEVLNQQSLETSDTLIYLFNPDTLFKSEDSLVVDHDTIINIIDQISSQNLIISRLDTLNGQNLNIKEFYQVKN